MAALWREDGTDELAAPPRRRGVRSRTIPEQIADHVAAAIVNGEYADGERLREQELAALYGASRGPVREAIRELQKHGLAILHPRRGAFAVGISLDVIAESFNIRAVLAGAAARQFARMKSEAGAGALAEAVAQLATLSRRRDVDPTEFARAVALCARAIYRHCGAGHLERTLRDHYHSSLWGLMWRAQPLDYMTARRRRETVALWDGIVAAVQGADDAGAERAFRHEVLTSRNAVLATLAKVRGQKVNKALLFAD